MIRARFLGVAFMAALIFAPSLAARAQTEPGHGPLGGAFCCAFEFKISNQTRHGADVTLERHLSGRVERVGRWVAAGQTIYVKMGAETYYDLTATFRAGASGSAKVGDAHVRWHLHQGSKARLIVSSSRYEWAG